MEYYDSVLMDHEVSTAGNSHFHHVPRDNAGHFPRPYRVLYREMLGYQCRNLFVSALKHLRT